MVVTVLASSSVSAFVTTPFCHGLTELTCVHILLIWNEAQRHHTTCRTASVPRWPLLRQPMMCARVDEQLNALDVALSGHVMFAHAG